MNDSVYHPVHFGEAQEVLNTSQNILDVCSELKKKCPQGNMAAFVSLIFYPACGTANLMKLWIISGRNKLYASQNRVEANRLADMIPKLEEYDEALVKEYMEVDDGYFDGFGLSEHIGFTTWCDEDNKYPLRTYVRPSNQSRMIVSRTDDEHYLTGDVWRDKPQVWNDALRPDVNQIEFDIARASKEPISFRITTDCPWLSFSCTEGTIEETKRIIAHIDRELFSGKTQGSFMVENIGHTRAKFIVNALNPEETSPKDCFWELDGYVAMEASHYQRKKSVPEGEFRILEPYGRTGSAIKVFPVTADFLDKEMGPYVEYDFYVSEQGEYDVLFYMAATTPVVYERKQYIGFGVNEGEVHIVNTVQDEDRQFFLSPQWSGEAYDNIKLSENRIECKEGKNTLRFYGVSPAIVLERIVIRKSGVTIPQSYLGPTESYYHKGERGEEYV
ncbi:MAG: hypothetical protein ACI4HQ_12740 [Acetatifactor sp.]